jgi:GNAT superfamily N-acetyltransferase
METLKTREHITIRHAVASDEAAWRELWSQYCEFYQAEVPEEVTSTTWLRILDDSSPVNAIVAVELTGEIVGFANFVLHLHTWSPKTLCYLEDLFVSPDVRGRDIGHSLIEQLTAMGRENGWGRVYWHTNGGNLRARRLYDRFVPADDVVHYVIRL